MPRNGYISEYLQGGRIVSHGRIESLENGFKIGDGLPFTLYIRPKVNTSSIDTTLSVKCYQDEAFSEAPFAFNDWSPLCVREIAPNSEALKYYDLYWGCGDYVGKV